MSTRDTPAVGTKPVLSPEFWRMRLMASYQYGSLHHSVYRCEDTQWLDINKKHIQILHRLIQSTDAIIDAGCAYGRLLHLLPRRWAGEYLGIDLSPDFIRLAQSEHPRHRFICADLRSVDLSLHGCDYIGRYAWAIFISVKGMIIREVGKECWQEIRSNMLKYAKRLLILEYDPDDDGDVEL